MLHTIQTHQFIKSDPGTIWSFMSDPRNLARITPAHMDFQILSSDSGRQMHAGQIIEYHVSPLPGVRLHWVTEITHVEEGKFFVDEQRFGPYAFWHHKHFLEPISGGVLMTDLVHYKLPFGPLGKLANTLFVKRQLDGIFNYRYQRLEEIFNMTKN